MGKQRRSFSEEFKRCGRPSSGWKTSTDAGRPRARRPSTSFASLAKEVWHAQASRVRPAKTVNRLKMRFVVSDVKTLVYAKIATS